MKEEQKRVKQAAIAARKQAVADEKQRKLEARRKQTYTWNDRSDSDVCVFCNYVYHIKAMARHQRVCPKNPLNLNSQLNHNTAALK